MEKRPKRRRPNPDPEAPREAGKGKTPRTTGKTSKPRPVRDMPTRLAEAEDVLRAIRSGEVDALLVSAKDGERVYTLSGAERPYRILIEAIGEGALTLSRGGTVLYANQALSRILGRPLEKIIGGPLQAFLSKEKRPDLMDLLAQGALESHRQEAMLLSEAGTEVPVLLTAAPLPESDPLQVCLVVTDLTSQRREAELSRLNEALKASEARFRTSVETMVDGFAILSAVRDEDGKIVDFRYDYINEAGCRMNGRSREETVGRSYTGLFPGIKESEWFQGLVRTVETGEPLIREAFVYTGIFVGGETKSRAYDLRAARMGDGLAFSWMDVTERKAMEEALRRSHEELEEKVRERTAALAESEERYRGLIETAEEGIWTIDAGERTDFINRRGAEILGYAPQEMIGRSPLEFLFPEDVADGREQLNRRRLSERGMRLVRMRSKSGSEVWVRSTSSPIMKREAVVGALAMFVDVTKEHKAEAALRETTRTLEELVAASPVGIAVLDPEGKVILWNPAMEAIFGWSEAEVRGNLPPAVAAGQEGAREELERLLAGERLAGVELRRERKDGWPVDVRIWTAPLWEESGRLKSTVLILLDVTPLKELERVALTQQKMATLGQVAAGVAHEIRNPLSGINIYLYSLEKLLGEADALDPETRQSAESIAAMMKGASARMEAVINRVLSFSRPGPARKEPFDVNACVREAVDMARVSLQKAGAKVAVALREGLPACLGDMRLLEQALLNLLSNATQAMEGQKGEKRIEVVSGVKDGCVTVTVADSGPGVPEEVRERIFEPFFTTKREGTGIGLSIAHRVITDHGGFIRLGTSRFGGALFTIGLPAVSQADN
jgi:PAS domain S-box-containing protein